jgi:hypothetical protein
MLSPGSMADGCGVPALAPSPRWLSLVGNGRSEWHADGRQEVPGRWRREDNALRSDDPLDLIPFWAKFGPVVLDLASQQQASRRGDQAQKPLQIGGFYTTTTTTSPPTLRAASRVGGGGGRRRPGHPGMKHVFSRAFLVSVSRLIHNPTRQARLDQWSMRFPRTDIGHFSAMDRLPSLNVLRTAARSPPPTHLLEVIYSPVPSAPVLFHA